MDSVYYALVCLYRQNMPGDLRSYGSTVASTTAGCSTYMCSVCQRFSVFCLVLVRSPHPAHRSGIHAGWHGDAVCGETSRMH